MSAITEFLPEISEAGEAASVARVAELAAELVRHIDQEEFFNTLRVFLDQLVDFDNFIVYRYCERAAAELIATNLDWDILQERMRPYSNGLYLLDPFYIEATSVRCRRVARMSEIAPEAFSESDYFKLFYHDVNVKDEVRFLAEPHGAELVHVFLERESPHDRFSRRELQLLRDLGGFVTGVVEQHWKWRAMRATLDGDSRPLLALGLRKVIGSLNRGALTAREIDIAELSFKGHAAKSIAHELGITEGTVISHKRHIYEKLQISSQSQFFHLLLETLYGNFAGPDKAAAA